MNDIAATFVVARNPEPDSTLPYIVKLPVRGGDVLLKVRDTWPRTAKVYCHPLYEWPAAAVIVDEAPVRACTRRGVAIDLVLDRPRENRSQFVFTRMRNGREGIFWQSPKTTRSERPGIRLPTRRAAGEVDLTIIVDTRERYAYKFGAQQADVVKGTLPAGDYGVALDGEIVAVVERKSLEDLSKGLVDGGVAYALAELATIERAALVVDGRYADLIANRFVNPGFLAENVAAMAVRYPTVPITFAGTRKLAEEWTFRYLGAALAYLRAERDAD